MADTTVTPTTPTPTPTATNEKVTKATVIIVGAGPSGLGTAAIFKQAEVDCIVLEKGRIGESFLQWPEETRFISPSFTGNFFGSVDLNAISPDSSPAFGLQSEHPTGKEYSKYLNDVVGFFKLDIRTGVTVTDITGAEEPEEPLDFNVAVPAKENGHSHDHGHGHGHCGSQDHEEQKQENPSTDMDIDEALKAKIMRQMAELEDEDLKYRQAPITLETTSGKFETSFVVWAGGEYQFPKKILNTVRPKKSYTDFPVGKHVLIGGSESGMDAAYHLFKHGCEVVIINETPTWEKRVSDSSYGLSPHTFGRVREMKESGKVEFVAEKAISITAADVRTKTKTFVLEHPAIDCTGFDMRQSLAGELFRFDGCTASLSVEDESTKLRNVFMVGPNVTHEKAVFCFIYKYRQRWAIVARTILERLGRHAPVLDYYASKNFMLDDLSCCADSCQC